MVDGMTDTASGAGEETAATADPSTASTAGSGSESTDTDAGAHGSADSNDRGDGRTRRGRFARSGDPEQPTGDGTAGADPEDGDPDALAEAGAADGDASADPTTTAGDQPFQVSAIGQTYSIPGATLDSTGRLTVAPESVEKMREFVGMAVKYESQRGQIQQDRQAIRTERLAVDHAQKVQAARDKGIMERIAMIRSFQTPEELYNWAAQFHADLPSLTRQSELDARQAKLDLAEQARQPDPAQQLEETTKHAEQTIDAVTRETQALPWAKGLDANDWKALRAKVERYPQAFFVMKEGQLYFDEGAFRAEAQERATLKGVSRTTQEKVTEARDFNAARQPKPNAAPPAARGKPASAGIAKAAPLPKNWREWNKANGI